LILDVFEKKAFWEVTLSFGIKLLYKEMKGKLPPLVFSAFY